MNSQDNQSMAEMVQTISKLALAQQQLTHQAEQQYYFEVEAVLRDKFEISNIQVSFPTIQICENLRNLWMIFYGIIRRFRRFAQIFCIRGKLNNHYSNAVEFDGIGMLDKTTIEFLGFWKKLSNPDFKPLEFDRFRIEAGNNYFVLANIEGMNAEFIHMGLVQGDRLKRLNEIAIRQMKTLTASNARALGDGK
jgi:hypothetical protein